jgi:hypothetical protein
MSDTRTYSGGCLCGAVRWEAHGEPVSQGYCCCPDCRKASGSGFIPWMMFSASVLCTISFLWTHPVSRDRTQLIS